MDSLYEDRFKYENMHVHSNLSGCALSEMTIDNIIRRAEAVGLKRIAITDHVDHTDTLTAKSPEVLLQRKVAIPTNVKVILGVETTQLAEDDFALPKDYFSAFDIVLVSANHYHRKDVKQPSSLNPKEWAESHMQMLWGALPRMRVGVDAFAHPFLPFKKPEVDQNAVLRAYDWDEIDRLIATGIAFEINPRITTGYSWFFARLILHGARWIRGTDAHRLLDLY